MLGRRDRGGRDGTAHRRRAESPSVKNGADAAASTNAVVVRLTGGIAHDGPGCRADAHQDDQPALRGV